MCGKDRRDKVRVIFLAPLSWVGAQPLHMWHRLSSSFTVMCVWKHVSERRGWESKPALRLEFRATFRTPHTPGPTQTLMFCLHSLQFYLDTCCRLSGRCCWFFFVFFLTICKSISLIEQKIMTWSTNLKGKAHELTNTIIQWNLNRSAEPRTLVLKIIILCINSLDTKVH